jgi:dienelactone hydrolase
MRIFSAIAFSLIVVSCYSQLRHIKNGPGKVGFVSLIRYDATRPAIAEQKIKDKGRILQINIWYPASGKGKSTSLNFADYVHLVGKEINEPSADTDWKNAGIQKYFEWPLSAGADKAAFVDFLQKQKNMQSLRDATVSQKEYPLVMLVHGYAADYAYMAENLAANGYIVLQVPVKGTTAYELDYEGKGLESQVLDYEFAMKEVERFLSQKIKTAATVGFSFGGQSALALAIRNPQVKAVISLDGGIGSAFGAALLAKQPYYSLAKINVPMLHLYNPKDTYTDLYWLRSYKHAPRTFIGMKNVEHGHFTSFGLLDSQLPGLMGKKAPVPGDAYETILVFTKTFIDEALRNQAFSQEEMVRSVSEKYPWIKNAANDAEHKPGS